MKIPPTIVVFLVLISLVFYDWSTTLPTTPEMERDAAAYIIERHKPLPARTFTQDGCTLFLNTILWHDLRPACLQHDIAYWAGGTQAEKNQADLEFFADIRTTGPLGLFLAYPMYWGVSYVGDSWFTRLVGANWGYGNNT